MTLVDAAGLVTRHPLASTWRELTGLRVSRNQAVRRARKQAKVEDDQTRKQ